MDKIVLLNSLKTKTGKTMIQFGIPITNSNFKKGFEILTDFIDMPDLHERFGVNDFGKTFDVEMSYHDTYNGQARKVISKLFDSNGEIIFER